MSIEPLSLTKYIVKISPKQKSSTFVCNINQNGDRVCYNNKYPNQIICDHEKCLINYKTLDQSYLNKKMPKSIKINLYDNGYLSTLQFIGVFPQYQLPNILKSIPNIPTRQVKKIHDPYFGIPKKPLKCRLNPFNKNEECKLFDL